MRSIYITTDSIGSETGGGLVTGQELEALQGIGHVEVVNPPNSANPFKPDILALVECKKLLSVDDYDMAQIYSGTYSQTVTYLKSQGVRVSYTCAAHDIEISRQEHELAGMEFFNHLIDPEQKERYLGGYRAADQIICPSTGSKRTMSEFGCKKIDVIPHGCHTQHNVKPIPKNFVVGYLGQMGPDKGVGYLMKAWGSLQYHEHYMIMAGKNSDTVWPLIRKHGGNVHLAGFVKSVTDFYNSCSVYVQPSATEGFGIEVLEAMSHGRPVICSEGAGAVDCVTSGVDGIVVPRQNAAAIADAIKLYKENPSMVIEHGNAAKKKASQYTWDKVRSLYQEAWENLCT